MTDQIDPVPELEQRERDEGVQRVRDRIAESFRPRAFGVDAVCIDCDELIEPGRLAALAHKTSRCASCAQDFERRLRMSQGRIDR